MPASSSSRARPCAQQEGSAHSRTGGRGRRHKARRNASGKIVRDNFQVIYAAPSLVVSPPPSALAFCSPPNPKRPAPKPLFLFFLVPASPNCSFHCERHNSKVSDRSKRVTVRGKRATTDLPQLRQSSKLLTSTRARVRERRVKVFLHENPLLRSSRLGFSLSLLSSIRARLFSRRRLPTALLSLDSLRSRLPSYRIERRLIRQILAKGPGSRHGIEDGLAGGVRGEGDCGVEGGKVGLAV